MKHSLHVKKTRPRWLKLVLSCCILALCASQASAQFSVSGKVISSEDQSSIPGANIIVKGTTNGTITDADGNFSITTQSGDDVLLFSFVGFAQQEVAIQGRNVVNVTLASDARQLSEVVVTALGIKREE